MHFDEDEVLTADVDSLHLLSFHVTVEGSWNGSEMLCISGEGKYYLRGLSPT